MAKKPAAEKPARETRKVLSPLKHNGRLYAEGESVALSVAEAAVLQKIGVVGAVTAGSAP